MRVEHLEGSPFAGGYRSDRVRDVWPVGDVRAVPREVGDYLVATFPSAFVEVRGGKRVARASDPPEVPDLSAEVRTLIDGFVAKAPAEARPALAAAIESLAASMPMLSDVELEAGAAARVARARQWVALGAPVEAAAEFERVDPALLLEPATAPDAGKE